MTQQKFLSLPSEAQSQVMDFIAVLRQKYTVVEPAFEPPNVDLLNHSFIGMWRDRQDLTDSTAWVRNIRENE
ncbi:MAG: hypothetical protein RMX68_004285 [Aulosira sp. ZfuVER01]|nr:hypothetical protein [Aulosira sp. ZfuVER01]MDZ8000015.1 hypothetical protein [Aulosira sp. DedVER01a]MDZ8051454.1 hypothetical protein [Aulosira sp. ZfuCHP01]